MPVRTLTPSGARLYKGTICETRERCCAGGGNQSSPKSHPTVEEKHVPPLLETPNVPIRETPSPASWLPVLVSLEQKKQMWSSQGHPFFIATTAAISPTATTATTTTTTARTSRSRSTTPSKEQRWSLQSCGSLESCGFARHRGGRGLQWVFPWIDAFCRQLVGRQLVGGRNRRGGRKKEDICQVQGASIKDP